MKIEDFKESISSGKYKFKDKDKSKKVNQNSQDYPGFQIMGTIEHIGRQDFDRVEQKKKTTKKGTKKRKKRRT